MVFRAHAVCFLRYRGCDWQRTVDTLRTSVSLVRCADSYSSSGIEEGAFGRLGVHVDILSSAYNCGTILLVGFTPFSSLVAGDVGCFRLCSADSCCHCVSNANIARLEGASGSGWVGQALGSKG